MSEQPNKTKGAIKFFFWGIMTVILIGWTWNSYTSGQLVSWYYYAAKFDGYAINSESFKTASKEKPASLEVGTFQAIDGLKAVKVKKGDLLPKGTNGVISDKIVKEGKRASLDGNTLKVTTPSEIKEAKGFKYKDTFKHKGVQTDPWSGLWNVLLVIGMGLCLGYMAEGFTDLLGIKLEKIKHYEGAH